MGDFFFCNQTLFALHARQSARGLFTKLANSLCLFRRAIERVITYSAIFHTKIVPRKFPKAQLKIPSANRKGFLVCWGILARTESAVSATSIFARRHLLLETVSAIYIPAWGRLKWNLRLVPTLGTLDVIHLARLAPSCSASCSLILKSHLI